VREWVDFHSIIIAGSYPLISLLKIKKSSQRGQQAGDGEEAVFSYQLKA
jgi:hypothetical protein